MAKKTSNTRSFIDEQNVQWTVGVKLPGSSSAMIAFHRVGAPTARDDRYAWYQADVPEARSVTSHLDGAAILQSLDESRLRRLFGRSMRVAAASDPLGTPVTEPAV